MKRILISEFKAKCIELLKNVKKTKEPILVTVRGEPIARVEPVVKPKKRVRLGAWKVEWRSRAILSADGLILRYTHGRTVLAKK